MQTGFALRWMSIFFTPFFVELPLTPAIGGTEVVKILAVLFIGYVIVFAATAYFVRGLQLLSRVSKKDAIGKDELDGSNEALELSELPLYNDDVEFSPTPVSEASSAPGADLSQVSMPPRAQSPTHAQGPGWPSAADEHSLQSIHPQSILQAPLPLDRDKRWAAFINANLDIFTYGSLFLFIGIPVYYAGNYAMPIHLTFNVLVYFFGLRLPMRIKRFLHPVLVSSGLTILGIYILALIHGQTLDNALKQYSTDTKYVQIWDRQKNLSKPGAGDIFSSCLDVGIVSLGMPMYTYRRELKRYFIILLIPLLLLVPASLFLYPIFCTRIGISQTRSLAFSSRALTLALAMEATSNIGGDQHIMAILCLVSGIFGALTFDALMRWMRIPEDDFTTRGVAMGANASAIGTAFLLVSDPRAGALASLSMGLLGALQVVVTCVPVAVEAVRGVVGL
ncbi:MAG: hypothetical protein M1834_000588 [Cirrosporium novae-zelandiae]|nr:MAG: hypothetical protein M1834_000588 [Cirrosporium novae-zelandiae]